MDKTTETTLIIERTIDATKEEVFDALTKESKLEQWFYPIERGFTVEAEFEAVIGSRYKIDMIDPDGKSYSHEGIIKELIPKKKLVFTWNSHVVSDTLVSIELQEVDKGTKVTLVHEFKPGDELQGHKQGWKELLENLSNLLTQG